MRDIILGRIENDVKLRFSANVVDKLGFSKFVCLKHVDSSSNHFKADYLLCIFENNFQILELCRQAFAPLHTSSNM